MSIKLLLKKFYVADKSFVTGDELKSYCRQLGLKYDTAVRYLQSQNKIQRIFKGVFYVKSLEELKTGAYKYNHLELVAKGLELKNIENWYFGLHTALKLNKMTHEYFAIEEVLSDKLFRAHPINITNYKFSFIKISPSLFKFGIKKDKLIRYSDPEKTILDFIYLWKYNRVPTEKIISDVSEWKNKINLNKIAIYAKNYPKTVKTITEAAFK